ncbi:MAG: radical SAM protein [Anaerolineales bacterium]|nr:radical SAM protein [Chloroflexota bacterium]MBL6980593.1 radical SAM protein [Anaerolineales bacterium]
MYNVFLLSACNLRCGYCFADDVMGRGANQNNAGNNAAKSINLEDYVRILDFLTASGVSIVSLVGGEPTLHPEFISIIQISLDRGFTVSVKSNATWIGKIGREMRNLPDEGIHFLLNINHPTILGESLWKRVVRNAKQLKGKHVDFQFNIDREDFDYRHILELASDVRPGKIVWSLSNMVKGDESQTFTDPLVIREQYAKQILEFVVDTGKLGIETVGVHGITPCMFSEQDYNDLQANGGSLESTCNPVFDILPDMSVLYCFPMSGFWDKKFIYEHNNLGEINREFQESLAGMRSDLYPLDECDDCKHFLGEVCHGGCIARHLDGQEKTDTWDDHFFDRIPLVAKRFKVEKMSDREMETYYILDLLSEERFDIDQLLYSLLNSIDGQSAFGDLYQNVFQKVDNAPGIESIFQEIATNLISRGVLRIRPQQKNQILSEPLGETV